MKSIIPIYENFDREKLCNTLSVEPVSNGVSIKFNESMKPDTIKSLLPGFSFLAQPDEEGLINEITIVSFNVTPEMYARILQDGGK